MNRERQGMLYDETRPLDVAIVGLGNIGSHAALALARLGARRMVLYDPDTVEDHNLSSQAYDSGDIGRSKVEAITSKAAAIDHAIEIHGEVSTFEQASGGVFLPAVLVCAVDSLEARRKIAASLASCWPVDAGPRIILDGRVGGSQVELHAYATPREWLEDIPKEAAQDPCGGRYICYSSLGIAALIANTCKRYMMREPYYARQVFHYDTLDIVKGRKIAGKEENEQ